MNNAGAGFLISSTGVIDSTGAWGGSHQIYYSFSASASLLRIHSLLITISSSSRRSLKSLQCEEANSYILSMSTAPVLSPLLMITRRFVPSLSTAKRSSSNSLYKRTQIHLYNNQFKEAMLINGFWPRDPSELNWLFHIQASSPAIKTQADGYLGIPIIGRQKLNEYRKKKLC